MKGRREKERGSPTPAMVRGLFGQPVGIEDLLGERLFRTRVGLPPRWAQYYNGSVRTRALGRQRTHELKFAY